MKTYITFFSLLFSLIIINNSYSQEINDRLLLFEYDRTFNEPVLLESYEIERKYISINDELMEAGALTAGSNINFELDGVVQEFSIVRAQSYVEGTYSVSARGGRSGRDRLLVTFEDDRMVGSVITPWDRELYYIRYDGERAQTYISAIDPSKLEHPECGVEGHEFHALLPDVGEIHKKSNRSDFSPNMSAMASTLTDIITIDLMIVYTDFAEEWADNSGFGSINAVIAESMNISQNALDNSDVFIELRLVHVYKTDYDETEIDPEDGGSTHLKRITASSDNNPWGEDYNGYMEEVHELRDEYGADLVAFYANQTGTGGLGWLLISPSGSHRYGFTLNDIRWVGSHHILIHEIGHNMGNHHARGQIGSPAGDRGGLFEYSTGHRWEGSTGNYTTVMGYTEETYVRIPHFSNPDVMWEGDPTGTYSGQYGPSDNARSMREIKAVIANYRPTMVDPPLISASENSIDVFIDREVTYHVPVSITNSGDSDLMWSVDFEPKIPIIAKSVPTAHKMREGEALTVVEPLLGNNSFITGGAIFTSTDSENTVLLSTGFESEEGFNPGTYIITQGWNTWHDSQNFEIANDNPASGNNHLRIKFQEDTDYSVVVNSPYFGPQPFGAFEFSVDLSFENMVSGDQYERLDIILFDASSGRAAYVVFFNGGIWVLDINDEGETFFTNSGQRYSTEGYENFMVVLNPDELTVDYYYGDLYLVSTPYINGKKFDSFRFYHWNDVPGTYVDIDNVQFKRLYDPFQWLNLSRYGGVAAPGSASDMTLTFTSVGVEHGEYAADMVLRSNDPNTPEIVIPLKLHVSDVVTVDGQPSVPLEFALLQNYPNPFNPQTVITFRLPESDRLRLEVYDIIGRFITTLIDDEMSAGEHQITYDVYGLSSGVYIYRLTTGAGTLHRTMVVTK